MIRTDVADLPWRGNQILSENGSSSMRARRRWDKFDITDESAE
jgi:hypothetical protein